MKSRVYISASVKDELRLKEMRNLIWLRTKAQEYYKKKTPHITIVPPFTVENENLDSVESIVSNYNLEGSSIDVKSLSVYENIHKPYVVQLDVQHNIHSLIDSLINELDNVAKSHMTYPASPHITLFKTQGWWDTVPDEIKRKLQDEILVNKFPDTEISSVSIQVR